MSNFYKKSNILFWRIEAGSGLRQALPNGICTPDTPDISGQMPPEVALLLPGPHSAAPLPDKDRLPRGGGLRRISCQSDPEYCDTDARAKSA